MNNWIIQFDLSHMNLNIHQYFFKTESIFMETLVVYIIWRILANFLILFFSVHFYFSFLFFHFSFFLLQILQGTLCIFLGVKLDINESGDHSQADKVNNFVVLVNFLLMGVNIVINTFDMKSSDSGTWIHFIFNFISTKAKTM